MSQIESSQPLIDTSKLTDSQMKALLDTLLKETEQYKKSQENQSLEIGNLTKQIQNQQETLGKYANENEILKNSVYEEKISKLKKLNRKHKKKIDNLKLQVAEEIYVNYQTEKKLLETLDKEESLLKSYKKLQTQYEALRKSKLGQLTLFYWEKRKQIKRGF